MANKENIEEINSILEKLCNVHYSAGPIHQKAERLKAQNCLKTNELEAIYHLVESHVPGLRMKTVLRYEKFLTSASDNAQLSLCKNHVALNCTDTELNENISNMLNKVEEMPAEWTLVQLTPHFNPYENLEISVNKYHTNPLYMTVFNCGKNQPKPFCVSVEAPKDGVTGSKVQLVHEIQSIIYDNKNTLLSSNVQTHFKGVPEKQNYYAKRQSIDDRLKMLVKDLQDLYLREWRCFLIGKYISNDLEISIQKRIKEFFKTESPFYHLREKTQSIIMYLIKGANYLKLTELRRAVQTFIPSTDKKLQKQLAQFIRNVSDELSLTDEKRHPLILIIDDSLDCFPWEMMDVLIDVSVSRLPSLHLAYALFQEHKETIKNGFKIVQNPENGTYVINPDLDLRNMQNRILSFYEYWLPKWKGVAGCKPTDDQFENMLVSGEIFAYNGHGNGSHFFPVSKIEKNRINAVVLLFGCGSTKLNIVGPQAEMYSTYHMYLIACSPCIVGNLWEVTDLDTDTLATDLISQWIPNPGKVHWRNLDKSKWKRGEKVNFQNVESKSALNVHLHEPELLKALSAAKKSNQLCFFITKAGIVARGIPVKIKTK